MAYVGAWLLKRASVARSSLDKSIVCYLLVMMASMFGGAVLYFLDPGTTGIDEALGLNMIVMTVAIIAVLRYWTGGEIELGESLIGSPDLDAAELQKSIIISHVYVVYFLVMMASMTATGFVYMMNTALTGLEEGLIIGTVIMTAGVVIVFWYAFKYPSQNLPVSGTDPRSVRAQLVRATLILLILLNEFLMAWTFVLVAGWQPTGSGLAMLGSAFQAIAGSGWFVFTVALEAILALYMLRNSIPRIFVDVVLLQCILVVFAPTAVENHVWASVSVYVGEPLLMGILFFTYLSSRRDNQNHVILKKYFFTLFTLFSFTIVGLLSWISMGSAIILVACIICEMVLSLHVILLRSNMAGQSMIGALSSLRSPQGSGQGMNAVDTPSQTNEPGD
jgi:hypothetical protein